MRSRANHGPRRALQGRTTRAASGASVIAVRLFEQLPIHPVVTIAGIVKLLETTKPTAGKAESEHRLQYNRLQMNANYVESGSHDIGLHAAYGPSPTRETTARNAADGLARRTGLSRHRRAW
jgi:hypothetical protein